MVCRCWWSKIEKRGNQGRPTSPLLHAQLPNVAPLFLRIRGGLGYDREIIVVVGMRAVRGAFGSRPPPGPPCLRHS